MAISYAEHERAFYAEWTTCLWCADCDCDVPESESEARLAGWEFDCDGFSESAWCPDCMLDRARE